MVYASRKTPRRQEVDRRYPFIRTVTEQRVTERDTTWADLVVPTDPVAELELFLAESITEDIDADIAEAAQLNNLSRVAITAVMTSILALQHRAAFGEGVAEYLKEKNGLTEKDVAPPKVLIVGSKSKARRVVAIACHIIEKAPLVPQVQTATVPVIGDIGLDAPALKMTAFLKEVRAEDTPDIGGDALCVTTDTGQVYVLDPPPEVVTGDTLSLKHCADAQLDLANGGVEYFGKKGSVLRRVSAAMPYSAEVRDYAKRNSMSPEHLRVLLTVLQSVATKPSDERFSVWITGPDRDVQRLLALAVSVWGWMVEEIVHAS